MVGWLCPALCQAEVDRASDTEVDKDQLLIFGLGIFKRA